MIGYGLVTVLAVGVLYLVLFLRFVWPAPDLWHREVVGYELKPDVEELYKANHEPVPSPRTLLDAADNNPELVWSPSSLNKTRAVLLVAWLLLTALVMTVFSAFVLQQMAARPAAGPPGRPFYILAAALGVAVLATVVCSVAILL